MGIFGGRSSSSSSVTNLAQDITKSSADYSQVDGPQSKLAVDIGGDAQNVTISSLDGGAIGRSFDFADTTTAALAEMYGDTLEALNESSQRETSTAMAALSKATTLESSQTLDLAKAVKWGLLLGAALLAWRIIKK